MNNVKKLGKGFQQYGLQPNYKDFLTNYIFDKLKNLFGQQNKHYIDSFIIDDNIPYIEDDYQYGILGEIIEKYYINMENIYKKYQK